MASDNKTNEMIRGFDPISGLQKNQSDKRVKLQKQANEARAETAALKTEINESKRPIGETQRRAGLSTSRAARKQRKRASLLPGASSDLSETLG